MVPFITDGLEAGEPVMVAVSAQHTKWLRDALDGQAEAEFVDMWQGHETIRPVADRSSEVGEASSCRYDASWPRQANWVKITPSTPAISNCSQSVVEEDQPGHRTTQRGQQTGEYKWKAPPKPKGRGQS